MVTGAPLGLGLPRGKPELLWGLKQRQMGWGEALTTSPCSHRSTWGARKAVWGKQGPGSCARGVLFPSSC